MGIPPIACTRKAVHFNKLKASSEYSSLSDATKRADVAYLRMIEAEFGNMPIEALSDPEVRGEFKRWRDDMTNTPRKADYACTNARPRSLCGP